jgi:hypothetical protein
MPKLTLAFVALIVSASLLPVGEAQAMQIQLFDWMAEPDQDEYVADLILGAQKVLSDSGHSDQAEQLHKRFSEIDPGGDVSLGMADFSVTMAEARASDKIRIAKNPDARRLEVEDAFYLMMKNRRIILPPAFFAVGNGFRPKYPPPR